MATPPPGRKQLLIYVTDAVHRALREEAYLRRMSMSAIVLEALERRVMLVDRSKKENDK